MPPEITPEELKSLNEAKAERDALKKEKDDALAAKLAADKNKKDDAEDPDLIEKSKLEREAKDKDSGRIKRLESSISFNMKASEFLKANEALLPKDVADIFAAAEKEKYEDSTEKADAIKAGVVQSFFAIQANVDLLTPGQNSQLAEYLKLTKTGKQEKAQSIYEMVFEPAFEMLKRVKKAEALQKGHGDGSDESYKKRLIERSRKHHLGEKNA